jgi:hypothetical protein
VFEAKKGLRERVGMYEKHNAARFGELVFT